MKKKAAIGVFFLVLFFLTTSTAFAEVQVRIRAIEASNVGSNIDPSLRDVHDQLRSLSRFTSYRLLKDDNISLSLNQPVNISIPNGRSCEITLLGQRRDMAECRVKIKQEGTEILNTQVRLFHGRTVLIAGSRHGEDVIIIAISTRF